jgi:hypothetical protein
LKTPAQRNISSIAYVEIVGKEDQRDVLTVLIGKKNYFWLIVPMRRYGIFPHSGTKSRHHGKQPKLERRSEYRHRDAYPRSRECEEHTTAECCSNFSLPSGAR